MALPRRRLEQPPDPKTPMNSYGWQTWLWKLWRYLQDYAFGGTVTGAASTGTGVSIVNTGASTGTTLAFKSLIAGANITIVDNGDGGIVISSTVGTGSGVTGVDGGSAAPPVEECRFIINFGGA